MGLCCCVRAFSSCGEQGLLIACGLQQLWRTGLVAPRHVGSSQTRARTRVPCIGRQIPNHCATREAPGSHFRSCLPWFTCPLPFSPNQVFLSFQATYAYLHPYTWRTTYHQTSGSPILSRMFFSLLWCKHPLVCYRVSLQDKFCASNPVPLRLLHSRGTAVDLILCHKVFGSHPLRL